MSQSIRYQVFVSSTFTDLREERAEVLQALWELDCIPTGMEAFLATNESQWEVIQKVIDECDYYVLIIGGRYGSVTSEGISYTEKEYDYAKSIRLPILGFIHGEPESIPTAKTERDEAGRQRLEAFRARVMGDHPVRKWTSAQELGGLVSRSLSRAIKVSPRTGWVRNSGSSSIELLEQVNALTKENAELKGKLNLETAISISSEELESGADTIQLEGHARIRKKGDIQTSARTVLWQAKASWDDIFRDIGPILINEADDDDVKRMLVRYNTWSPDLDRKIVSVSDLSITPETFAEVVVQLRALGLIDKGIKKRAVSDRGSYWRVTDKGERHLIGLLARRKSREQGTNIAS